MYLYKYTVHAYFVRVPQALSVCTYVCTHVLCTYLVPRSTYVYLLPYISVPVRGTSYEYERGTSYEHTVVVCVYARACGIILFYSFVHVRHIHVHSTRENIDITYISHKRYEVRYLIPRTSTSISYLVPRIYYPRHSLAPPAYML